MDKNKKEYFKEKVFKSKGKGIIEDSTEYGEFISTFDHWITPEEQKKIAEHLENLGD